ncbi:unnamed protein product [Mytilus edulis]|uniref:Uncharacterized protein n=1 Tax=Mytilus edulis TaxID=6550 RepID=A0A8S3UM96_MYTED|nr:unnamed protein product [Mytilus edulis]
MKRRRILEVRRLQIIGMQSSGLSYKAIVRQMTYHYTVVSRLLWIHIQTNNVMNFPKSGRPLVTSQRKYRALQRRVRRMPFATSPFLKRERLPHRQLEELEELVEISRTEVEEGHKTSHVYSLTATNVLDMLLSSSCRLPSEDTRQNHVEKQNTKPRRKTQDETTSEDTRRNHIGRHKTKPREETTSEDTKRNDIGRQKTKPRPKTQDETTSKNTKTQETRPRRKTQNETTSEDTRRNHVERHKTESCRKTQDETASKDTRRTTSKNTKTQKTKPRRKTQDETMKEDKRRNHAERHKTKPRLRTQDKTTSKNTKTQKTKPRRKTQNETASKDTRRNHVGRYKTKPRRKTQDGPTSEDKRRNRVQKHKLKKKVAGCHHGLVNSY